MEKGLRNPGVAFNVNKVKKLMLEQGLTYGGLGDKCGYHRTQISNLLRVGRARPFTLKVIADALGVTISDLLPSEESNNNKIKVMLDDGAIVPTRAHPDDGGLDLYSPIDTVICGTMRWSGCSVEIDTGVHVQIPKGYVGDIKTKSSFLRADITTDGTVDCGYTGSIHVKLFNHGQFDFHIEKGQKIAQLVLKKIITPEVEVVDILDETERGAGGFGSSGKF